MAKKPTPAKKAAVKSSKVKGVDLDKMVATIDEDLKNNPPNKRQIAKAPVKPKAEPVKKAKLPSTSGLSTSTLLNAMGVQESKLPVNPGIGSDLGPKTLVDIPTKLELRKPPVYKPQTSSEKVSPKDIFKAQEPKRSTGFNFKFK